MRVLSVVGARPNFMKVAPIIRAMKRHPHPFECVLVHTGQHYDVRMSDSFFHDLGLPQPDHNLEVGSGTHAAQTAAVMTRIEPVLQEVAPDLVLVVGDVNSTLAAAITAKKLNLRVAHVEAGLRSFDMTMPEEINRLCTDAISDDLFTTDRLANENLVREGVAEDRIHFVGNVMIDSLTAALPAARKLGSADRMALGRGEYAVLTLHRPANVDQPAKLAEIMDAILDSVGDLPIVFPAHPRTAEKLAALPRVQAAARDRLRIVEPLGYLAFLSLLTTARIVLTDSGGLQEETTILGVPCVTLRENTERPITLEYGANRLAGVSRAGIMEAIGAALALPAQAFPAPEFWDGKAAERIAQTLVNQF
jgi:UDP-N-acetylglucosamine 2-epimerase (non-hydrolysing)